MPHLTRPLLRRRLELLGGVIGGVGAGAAGYDLVAQGKVKVGATMLVAAVLTVVGTVVKQRRERRREVSADAVAAKRAEAGDVATTA